MMMRRVGIPLIVLSVVLFLTGLVLWNTALSNTDEDAIIRQWVVSYSLMYGSVIIGVAGLILVVLSWAIPPPEDAPGPGAGAPPEHGDLEPAVGPVVSAPSPPPEVLDSIEDVSVEDAILFCGKCHQPNVPGTIECTRCGRPLRAPSHDQIA